jgi:bleomycin hydrolase
MFKKQIFLLLFIVVTAIVNAQSTNTNLQFLHTIQLPVTSVKNQDTTGTCWCFGGTSLLESQYLKSSGVSLDLSEMFIIRNIYIDKAKNYILRQGHAQFGEGGLGHDVINAIAAYGDEPLSVYNGLKPGEKVYNHAAMVITLKNYLDSILKTPPIPGDWLVKYTQLLDDNLGTPPATFQYNGTAYTPKTFSTEIMKFNADDYVNITSLADRPYYESFILQVPDNFSNGYYYNLPLDEMILLAKTAIKNGYSFLWDTDASNNGFLQDKGLALLLNDAKKYNEDSINEDMKEEEWNENKRLQLYENLTTQDDHLMHVFGIEQSKGGKTFFLVKNSWGNIGPCKGDINASEAYFAINTVSLVIPKAAFSKELLAKLKIK